MSEVIDFDTSQYYHDLVKQAVKDNKDFAQIVHELQCCWILQGSDYEVTDHPTIYPLLQKFYRQQTANRIVLSTPPPQRPRTNKTAAMLDYRQAA